MHKILVTQMLILISTVLYSQHLSIGFHSGTGTYSMKELKSLNEYTINNLPFDTKTVANFPPFINYGASVLLKVGKISAGLTYSFLSTGSRVSGKDYSGEYRFDMLIKSSAPGIYCSMDTRGNGKFLYSFYTSAGLMFSDLDTKEFLLVQENTFIDETYKFTSSNLYAEPGIKVTYPLNFIDIGLNAGYAIQFSDKMFRYKEDKEIYLVNPDSGDRIKPGWHGLRAGVTVSYTFKSHKKE